MPPLPRSTAVRRYSMMTRRSALSMCLLAILAAGMLPSSRARAQAPPGEIVPGEVLVGVRAEADDRSEAARLTTNFGVAVASQPTLHAYRYLIRQGVSVQ